MRNDINKMIAEAMKNGNKNDLNTLRAIKAAFMNWSTSADNAGKEMTDADEVKVLLKMKAQREDSIKQYKDGGRMDLANLESAELATLLKFMPEMPTDEDIEKYTNDVCESLIKSNGGVSMKDMKLILEKVQVKYPTASGKNVSKVVKSKISC